MKLLAPATAVVAVVVAVASHDGVDGLAPTVLTDEDVEGGGHLAWCLVAFYRLCGDVGSGAVRSWG